MSTAYTSDLPDAFFREVRAIQTRLAPDNAYFADWLLTMMQSESGIKPNVGNPIAPYYGLIQQGASSFKPLSPDQFKALSVVEQLPYVEKFYQGSPVADMKTAGNLYQFNFVPKSIERGLDADTVIAAKDGKGYVYSDGPGKAPYAHEPYFYSANAGLDTDGNGAITVGDLDARLAKLAKGARIREAVSRLPTPEGGYPPAAPMLVNAKAPGAGAAAMQANMGGAAPGLLGAGAVAVGVAGLFAWRKWSK